MGTSERGRENQTLAPPRPLGAHADRGERRQGSPRPPHSAPPRVSVSFSSSTCCLCCWILA